MNESFKILNIELENFVRNYTKSRLNQIKKIQNLFDNRLSDLNNYEFLPGSNWENIDKKIDYHSLDLEIKEFQLLIDALEESLDAIYSISKEGLYDSSNNFINKILDYSKFNKNDWQNTSSITNIADYVDLHTILYSFRKQRNPDPDAKIPGIFPIELFLMKGIKQDLKDLKYSEIIIYTKHLTENYNISNKSHRIKTRDFNELIQKSNKDQDIDMLKIINLFKLFYQTNIILISPYAIEIPEYNQNIISLTESDLFDNNLVSVIKNLNSKTTLIFNITIDENNYGDNEYAKNFLLKIEKILNLNQENSTTFRISPVINKDIILKQIEGVIDFQIQSEDKDQQLNKAPLNIFEYFLPILKVSLDLSEHIDRQELKSKDMDIRRIRKL